MAARLVKGRSGGRALLALRERGTSSRNLEKDTKELAKKRREKKRRLADIPNRRASEEKGQPIRSLTGGKKENQFFHRCSNKSERV